MANIKSQIKRIRTNEAARLRNKSVKSALKTAVRRVRSAADVRRQGRRPGRARRRLAQPGQGRVQGRHPPNQAANRKSALAQLVNSL